MLDTYRKLNTTDWMQIGRELLARKEEVLACLSDDSNARKKAAATRFFYSFAQTTYGIKQGTARQLIRNYQRFGGSSIRADLELAFTISELTILAARTDDEVASALALKLANPALGREELRAYLKSLSGEHVRDHGH